MLRLKSNWIVMVQLPSVEFEVISRETEPTADTEDAVSRIVIQLGGGEGGDGEDQAEWGGLGFLFVLGALSFADARPRGYSEKEFIEGDELGVADFLHALRFVRGELHLEFDYLRGAA